MDSTFEEDRRELRSLGNVLQHLFEEGLISNMEYRKSVCTNLVDRRGAIYQLLLSKDFKTASIILKIFRQYLISDTHGLNTEASTNTLTSVPTIEKNPLLNETIISVVFGFLSINDLKRCRYVSQKWSAVADPVFRKRAKVVFRDSDCVLSPTTFIDTFKYTLPGIPFTAFSFSGRWSISELSSFFTIFGKNITELEFNRIIFEEYQDFDHEDNLKYDVVISSWISQSKLKKLHITDCFTKFIVPFSSLISVLDLSMNYVVIKIDNDPSESYERRIAPKQIFLRGVDFYRGRTKVKNMCVDDIIDFRKASNITLRPGDNNTKLTLDLSALRVNAKCVKLYNMTVLNWATSKWNIEKLTLSHIPLVERPNMDIKELRYKEAAIDLILLPHTIERLVIKYFGMNRNLITCSQRICFPNLKFLHCDYIASDFSFISKFKSCFLLEELILCGSGLGMKINLNWIPPSVRKLKLGSNIQVLGGCVFPLDQLVLEDYPIRSVRRLISKFKLDLLVLLNTWNGNLDFKEIKIDLVPFLRQNNDVENIYVGIFHWDIPADFNMDPFEDSGLHQMVDKKAKSYSFVNNVGSPVTIEEFNQLANLKSTN